MGAEAFGAEAGAGFKSTLPPEVREELQDTVPEDRAVAIWAKGVCGGPRASGGRGPERGHRPGGRAVADSNVPTLTRILRRS